MRYSYFVLILCITFTLSISCKEQKNDCPYFEGVATYFKNEYNLSLKDVKGEHLYYVLDLQGCEPCTNLNTKMLLQLKDNNKLTIVFIGETGNHEFLKRVNIIKEKFKHLEDKELKIYDYQTNLAKPLLIHIKDGKCNNIMEVIDPIIKDAKQYIDSI